MSSAKPVRKPGMSKRPTSRASAVNPTIKKLKATYNSMVLPLRHYHYDIFELEVERFEMRVKVSFLTNVKGDIDTLIAPLEPTANDIVFRRAPRKEMMKKSFLEKFLGEYEFLS